MKRRVYYLTISALFVTALFVTATAAVAGTFTVTLTNGTSFETRYRPVEAEWDAELVRLTSDRGNNIALLREEIAAVTSSVEETGFGYQVDTTTLFVGWSPSDAADEGEEGEQGERFDFPEAAPSFTVEQFVNPDSTGSSGIGGIDTGF